MNISLIQAIEILDSRGNPTVRTFITLHDGSVHHASVPSGASTGTYEAWELRDGDKARFGGKGVTKAVENVNTTIAQALKGQDVSDPRKLDEAMLKLDGTENKANLGANAILSVSMALTRAAAYASRKPLWKFINEYYMSGTKPSFPRLMVNVVNGGAHANWNFDIQEFMIMPKPTKPTESVRMAAEIFQSLGKEIKGRSLSTLVGDEGGFSPKLASNDEVFELIEHAAKAVGYHRNEHYEFGVDCAANEFYHNGNYHFQKTNEDKTSVELIEYYANLGQKYNIQSFEDAFAEDDWDAFSKFNAMATEHKFQLVGDDLFVTNMKRIQKGIDEKAANAVLVKVNQIGSVSEAIDAINMTRNAGWNVIVSHRSGETEDAFIADLAYGVGADFIKTGSMSRSDRLAKYNRLIEIQNGI
ncbi:MAG: phosphopyruvate hydratase [bacterium]|nr:phosphopyruvate hydratase [bacterium]